MATADDIRAVLDVLCRYYRDKENQPRKLDPVQIAVYLDGLSEFQPDDLEFAARQWMRKSRWFPALSDLRELLIEAAPDWDALGHVAWTNVERAISAAGIYRGATFEDGAVGETVRQVFGSWSAACSYDRDSPGWAIRRQTFLQIFPMIAKKGEHEGTVTLRGISNYAKERPLLIAHEPLLPKTQPHLSSPDRTHNVLAEITRRFKALQSGTKESA